MLRLVARHKREVLRFDLDRGRSMSLGSDAANDIVLNVAGVSKHHALLKVSGSSVVLSDRGSKNGLVLAGRREKEVSLSPGIEVQLGKCFVEIEDVPESDTRLGLTFAFGQSGSGDTPHWNRSETASLDDLRPDHPAAAALAFLHLVLRRGVLDRESFRKARQVLGATALFSYEASHGQDVAVLASEGPIDPIVWSDPHLLQAIHEQRSRPCDVTGDEMRLWLSGRSSAGPCLAAVFGAGESYGPGDWRRDFFAILSGILGVPDDLPERHFSCDPEPLQFPERMVVGKSPAMENLLDDVRAYRGSWQSFLLFGETGTGKELIARLLHKSGPTRDGPWVPINVGAISADLFESEVFGIESGVATGVKGREGIMSSSNGGTLFLDEVGDLPAAQQVKLLRVLQEHCFRPVGGVEREVRFRVIAASNRNLDEDVEIGRFRKDLYYRLCGHQLRIPPLRERPEDIPGLVEEFISRAAEQYGRKIRGASVKVLKLLAEYAWPGNIRQLEKWVDGAVQKCEPGGTLESKHFELAGTGSRSPLAESRAAAESPSQVPPSTDLLSGTLHEMTDQFQSQLIREILASTQGNKSEAARQLGLTRKGLRDKIRRLKISLP